MSNSIISRKTFKQFADEILLDAFAEYEDFAEAKQATLDALSDGEALKAWGFTADPVDDEEAYEAETSFVDSAYAYVEAMTEDSAPQSMHGGSRKGAGRKVENTKQYCVRLTEEDHALMMTLGGSRWIRTKLSEVRNAKIFVFRPQNGTVDGIEIMSKKEFERTFELDKTYDEWVANGGTLDEVMVFDRAEDALNFLKNATNEDKDDWFRL